MSDLTTLDVVKLPTRLQVGSIDLGSAVDSLLRDSVWVWTDSGLIHPTQKGIGVAFASPELASVDSDIDYSAASSDPTNLVGLVYSTGPTRLDRNRSVADAVRMMRAAARTTIDTLEMQHTIETNPFMAERFQGVVESVEPDGTFAWGEISEGGAAFVRFRDLLYLASVSGFRPEENHWLALMIGGFLAAEIANQTATQAD